MSKLNDLINKFCPQGVEYVRLGDVCILNRYKQLGAEELKSLKTNNGDIHLLPSSRDFDWITNKQLAGNSICKGEVFTLGRARYANPKYVNGYFISSNNIIIESKNREKISTKYLYYFVISNKKRIYVETSTYPKFDKPSFNMLKIPLPPLCVQEEIVKILDKFTDLENELENELRMRKMQFNAYRDKLLTFDNGVRFEKINTCYKLYSGMSGVSQKWQESGNCKFIDYKNVYNHLKIDVHDKPYANVKKLSQNIVRQYDILITTASEIPNECAITAVVEENIEAGVFLDDHLFGMHLIDNKVNSTFVNYYMQTQSFKNDVRKKVKGVTRFYVSPSDIGTLTIPVPPLEKQKEIVEKLDKFNEMCNEISDGLPLEIELRKKQYEFYRNKLLSFDKKAS